MTRVTCEQGAIQPVFTQILNTESIKSDSPSPSIDIAGNSVHVVWSDSADSSMNQGRVAYRRLALDGTSSMDAETFVDFRFAGEPLTRFFHPDIIALPGDEAIIAAIAGNKSVVLQRVEQDGKTFEDAVGVATTVRSLRTRPSITAGATGPVWVAWLEPREFGDSQYRVGYASFERRTFEPMGEATRLDTLSIRGQAPRLARRIINDESVFLVEQSNNHHTRLYNAQRSSSATEFGARNLSNTSPSVTSTGDGGAVAWFSRQDPSLLGRQVNVQTFRDSGGRILLDTAKTIATIDGATAPQLPGRPEIVWVGGDTYFVAVQDGPTPSSTELKGYLVELSAP